MTKKPEKDFEEVQVNSQKELRDWLLQNHKKGDSVWLVTWKSSHQDKYVSRNQVLDELISFGWIDGIRSQVDEDKTKQLISPRKTQHWHRSYKIRAEKLIKLNQMHSSGYESIKKSKQSGLWNFMDEVDNLIVPKDLEESLSENKKASNYFQNLNDSYKRNLLRYLKLAKSKKTRIKRVEVIVNSCIQEKRIRNM